MEEYPAVHERKIGILGGTFDPIHFGHINLALCLKEVHDLREVLFCQTPISPLKHKTPPCISTEHRTALIQLAIEDIPGFVFYDGELNQKPPHYTIDTVKKLLEDAKDEAGKTGFYLLLGEDVLSELDAWKDVKELLELAPPLVGSRFCTEMTSPFKLEICQIPLFDISSTEIRRRLEKGLYCGHLLPAKVLDYIYHHKLYF